MYSTFVGLGRSTQIQSNLIEPILNGEEEVIGNVGKPVAKLMPYQRDTRPRLLGAGQWQGNSPIVEDFDDYRCSALVCSSSP